MESESGWRQKIDTAQDLRSLVRTMKALSAASIRQYEIALDSLNEFNHTTELGFMALLRSGDLSLEFDDLRQRRCILGAIVFGSDQGLCGRYNEVIVNYALDQMNGLHISQSDRHIITIGTRVQALFDERDVAVHERFSQPSSAATISKLVELLSIGIQRWQRNAGVNHVLLFYNQQAEHSTHTPCTHRLLPLQVDDFKHLGKARWPAHGLPVFSMQSETLFAALVRQQLYIGLFRASVDSLASEHASRLQSMQGAERNIDEQLQTMAGQYRRSRQAAITQELLEVVSGYEVLMKGDH